jgi:DNA modification methylase
LIEVGSSWILQGDVLAVLASLPDQSVHCCVTSPPYFGLRDYGQDGQIGLEKTPQEYVEKMVAVFREVRRVLRDDGTLWLNLGDCYKDKNRLMIPARVALSLQVDGWVLRDEIVWHKPRTTPAPVKDRTVAAHEMLYLFSKMPGGYFFDYLAIEETAKYPGAKRAAGKAFRAMKSADPKAAAKRPGEREIVVRGTRRKRSVWSVSPQPYKAAHFATFPPDLIQPCILAGCPVGGMVLDPFGGSGTTGLVADRHGRNAILIELNPEYIEIAKKRLSA